MPVHLEGEAEMAANLMGMARALTPAAVVHELELAAEPIRAKAAATAPRGPWPPHLADHIGISVVDREGGLPAVAIGPTVGFAYGRFQEWGTIHHPAQPFMRPAIDTGAAEAFEQVGAGLFGIVEGANRGG